MTRLTRFGYYLAIVALVGLVLLAWTSIPDCWQPGVCG